MQGLLGAGAPLHVAQNPFAAVNGLVLDQNIAFVFISLFSFIDWTVLHVTRGTGHKEKNPLSLIKASG